MYDIFDEHGRQGAVVKDASLLGGNLVAAAQADTGISGKIAEFAVVDREQRLASAGRPDRPGRRNRTMPRVGRTLVLTSLLLAAGAPARGVEFVNACEASVTATDAAPDEATTCGSFTLSASGSNASANQSTSIDRSGGVVSTSQASGAEDASAASSLRVAGEFTERFRFVARGVVTAASDAQGAESAADLFLFRDGLEIAHAFAFAFDEGGGFSGDIDREGIQPAGLIETRLTLGTSGPASSATWDLDLQAAECTPPPLVATFKQGDPKWAADAYDTSPHTIAAKGCWLSSLAMALRVAGQTQLQVGGATLATDPGALNQFMTATPGAFSGFNVNPGPTTEAASGGTLRFFAERINATTDRERAIRFVQRALCDGFPVVVGVKLNAAGTPGHYVLVTDMTGPTFSDFTIVDPGPNNDSLADYGNAFATRGFLAPVETAAPLGPLTRGAAPASDRSALYLATSDHVTLLVTDPSGRRTGIDPAAGTEVDEIPKSTHFADRIDDDVSGATGAETSDAVYVYRPASGSYRIEASAFADGPFVVTMHVVSRSGVLRPALSIEGEAQQGATSSFEVSVDTTPSACEATPPGATFRSLSCRLAALAAQVDAPGFGPLQAKLRGQLARASVSRDEAESRCREPKRDRVRRSLRKTIQRLGEIEKTLRSRAARNGIPQAIRDGLQVAVQGLRADVRALRSTVRCPQDTPVG